MTNPPPLSSTRVETGMLRSREISQRVSPSRTISALSPLRRIGAPSLGVCLMFPLKNTPQSAKLVSSRYRLNSTRPIEFATNSKRLSYLAYQCKIKHVMPRATIHVSGMSKLDFSYLVQGSRLRFAFWAWQRMACAKSIPRRCLPSAGSLALE